MRVVEVETGRHVAVEEVRFRKPQVDLLADARHGHLQTQELAAAKQVLFRQADRADDVVGRREAGADRKLARRLLFDFNVQNCAIRRRAGFLGDLDLLEVTQAANARARAIDQDAVERVAFHQADLTADDLVQRARIADHVDAFDVDARTLFDLEDDIDGPAVLVAAHTRTNVDERIALRAGGKRDRIDALVDHFGVVLLTALEADQLLQFADGNVLQLRVDFDLAEIVALAFFDRERDVEPAAVGREFGDGRNHPEIGEALAEVEPSQLLAVKRQPVRIVVVVRLQEIPPDRFAGRDLVAQRTVAEFLVADEDDSADAGRRAFADFEHEIDAVLRQLHGLRFDLRRKPAAAAIDFDDALNVALHLGARKHHARLQLHFVFERLLRNLRVTLERDAVDDRILDHLHQHAAVRLFDLHVGEQAGGEKRL